VSDRAGQAHALTVMTPIVPGEEGALRAYLEGLSPQDSPLARVPGVHFGRWAILTGFVDDPDQPRQERLSTQYLIFTTCSDGPFDAYMDELCAALAPEAGAIWGRCVGCPEPAEGDALKRYLLHNRIRTGLFVAAYPRATLAAVRSALEQRERTIDLAVRSQGMEPAELKRAFEAELDDG
jgi:hypothetical protein